MSGTEDSDPDWGESSTKKNITKQIPDSSHKSNLPVQRFCEKWLKIFDPWLARCSDNPNKPFCRACQTKLDCNRCHLQRHERTSKHARNLKILVEKGEEAARENYNMRQEKSKYYQQRKKLNALQMPGDFIKEENDEDYIEDDYNENESFDFVQADESTDQFIEETTIRQKSNAQFRSSSFNGNNVTLPQRKNPSASKKDRMRLLMQIQKDKNDIMNTFKDLLAVGNNAATISPPQEKSNVDLFFESVSSSVKALSPKLIAEAKMRVSQLICELELRALTEADQGNTAETIIAPATIVLSPNTENGYVLHRTIEGQQHEEHATQDYESLH